MRKKILMLLMVVSLVCSIWTVTPAYASTSTTSKVQAARAKRAAALQNLKTAQQKLKYLQDQVNQVQGELGKTDNQINAQEKQLQANQVLLDQERVKFDKVVVRMYRQGQLVYVEELLKSKNFSDFLNRLEIVRVIVKRERSTLNGYITIKDNIEQQKVALEDTKKKQQADLAVAQDALNQFQGEYTKAKVAFDATKDSEHVSQGQMDALKVAIGKLSQGPTLGTGSFQMPCAGVISWNYHQWRGNHWHDGIDISRNLGDPMYAVDSGVVVMTQYDPAGYGYFIVISHGNGLATLYGHMYPSTVRVHIGEHVTRGQQIAKVGNFGRSTGPHLHFEVHVNGATVNPKGWLPAQ